MIALFLVCLGKLILTQSSGLFFLKDSPSLLSFVSFSYLYANFSCQVLTFFQFNFHQISKIRVNFDKNLEESGEVDVLVDEEVDCYAAE